MNNQPTKAQQFERLFGQRICVHFAQGCMGQMEAAADLSRKATLVRIVDACGDVFLEIESEIVEGANDARS